MIKIKLIVFFLFLSILPLIAQQADDVIGEYHLPNKLDVRIFKYKGKYYGKIIALNGYENGQTKDFKNPNSAKHNDFLLEKVIIRNLEFDKEDKEWINGSMYGAEKGMIFNLKIVSIKGKEVEVVGSKYLFWKTIKWVKLK